MRLAEAALAMTFMTLALMCRLSFAPALLLLWVYVVWRCQSQRLWCVALVAGNVFLLVAVGVYFWSDGNMFFGVYTLHNEFYGNPPWRWVRFKIFLAGWFNNQLPIVVGLSWAVVHLVGLWRRRGWEAIANPDGAFLWFVLCAYGATTLVHCINVQSWATHQSANAGLAVVFVALVAAESVSRAPKIPVALVSLMVLLASMPFQEWVISVNGKGSLRKLDEVVGLIRQHAAPDDRVLSFSAEVVVDSGLRGVPGYDLSEFSFFPAMTDERVHRLKTTNLGKLYRDISEGRGEVLCVTRGMLDLIARGNVAIERHLRETIAQRYEQRAVIHEYGQFLDDIYVFSRRRGT